MLRSEIIYSKMKITYQIQREVSTAGSNSATFPVTGTTASEMFLRQVRNCKRFL